MPEFSALTANGNSILRRAHRKLFTLPKSGITVAIALIQVLLWYGDYSTGPFVPFGVFYLLTLYFAVKYAGVNVAYVMAIIVVSGKTYIKYKLLPGDDILWQLTLQFFSSLSIYAAFCYLINSQMSARKYAEAMAVQAIKRAGAAEHKLLSIAEETQQRIGRELHDDLGQHLTGAAFMAQVLASKLEQTGVQVLGDAQRVTSMLNEAIVKTRNLAHGLYPEEIKTQGLPLMLEKLASHVESIYSIRCVFMGDANCRIDDHEVAIHLFRITQESINNAVKHGQASHLTLNLHCSAHTLKLEILDNGSGFNQLAQASSSGLGLRSMRYRADIIGASLDIAPRAQGGMRVAINMQFEI